MKDATRTYYSSERKLTLNWITNIQHVFHEDNLYYVMKLDNNGILSYYVLHFWKSKYYWLQIPSNDNKSVEYLLPTLGYKEAELSYFQKEFFSSLNFKLISLDTMVYNKLQKHESFQSVCKQLIRENLKLI